MKRVLYIISILIAAICVQSCSSTTAIEGNWICTDAQADDTPFEELDPAVQTNLKAFVGGTLSIEGGSFTRRQEAPEFVFYVRGVFSLSGDQKTLTVTYQQMAEAKHKWFDVSPELAVPIPFDVLLLNDKEFQIRTKAKTRFGVAYILSYKKN